MPEFIVTTENGVLVATWRMGDAASAKRRFRKYQQGAARKFHKLYKKVKT